MNFGTVIGSVEPTIEPEPTNDSSQKLVMVSSRVIFRQVLSHLHPLSAGQSATAAKLVQWSVDGYVGAIIFLFQLH